MKKLLAAVGMVFALSTLAIADGPSRPGPSHPPPKKPNPVKPIEHPVHPVPTKPVPVVIPHTPVAPGKAGGVQANKPFEKKNPPKTITVKVPSHQLNAWTKANSGSSKGRVEEGRRRHPAEFERKRELGKWYGEMHRGTWEKDGDRLKKHYSEDRYRYYHSRLFAKGFCGGYYYPVRPAVEITQYFEYPVTSWFYEGETDPDYYAAYYGPEYYEYPVTVFPYASVYYPTDTLRDLGIDASSLPLYKQANFRQSVIVITDLLRKQISDKIGSDYQFGQGEIVLTHYENLKNEVYVLEGFVEGNNVHVPFKAVVDLEDSTLSTVYAAFDPDATGADLDVLNWINDRIVQFGGDPTTAYLEPAPVEPITVNPPVEPITVNPPVEPITVNPPVVSCKDLPALPVTILFTVDPRYARTNLWMKSGGANAWTDMGVVGLTRTLSSPALDPCQDQLSYDVALAWVNNQGYTQMTKTLNVPVKSGANLTVKLP